MGLCGTESGREGEIERLYSYGARQKVKELLHEFGEKYRKADSQHFEDVLLDLYAGMVVDAL